MVRFRAQPWKPEAIAAMPTAVDAQQRLAFDQAQVHQRVDDGAVAHLGGLRVVVLATFQGDGHAARAAHVLGGAHAVGLVQIHGTAHGGAGKARAALGHAVGVGVEPAVHPALHAQHLGQRQFGVSMAHGLQRAVVVDRAHRQERLALGLEAVQVEQHLVLGHQRTQPVGDVVLELLGLGGGSQPAVEVAIAIALALLVGQRVGDGHEGDLAAQQPALIALELGHDAADGLGAAHLIAVHGAGDQNLGAACDGRELDGLERMHGVQFASAACAEHIG